MYAVVGNHLLPQVAIDTNEEIRARYGDIELMFVPEEMRSKPDAPPFALINTISGDLIRYFDESEVNANQVLQWIYDNDTQRHGENTLWQKFIEQVDDEKRAREKQQENQLDEKIDFVTTVAKSKKHIFKHDGMTFGA